MTKKYYLFSLATVLLAGICSSIFAQNLVTKQNPRFEAIKSKSLSYLRSENNLAGDLDLQVKQIKQDQLAMYHTKVQQMVEKVPVWTGEAIVHLKSNESFFSVTDRLIPDINIDTTPVLTEKMATERAIDIFQCKKCLTSAPTVDLWAMRHEGGDYLVYRVQLKNEDGTEFASMPVYFIDAHTGELVWDYNNMQHQSVNGTGTSLYSGTVSMKTSKVCTTTTPTPTPNPTPTGTPYPPFPDPTPPPGGHIPFGGDVKGGSTTATASAAPAPTPVTTCTYYLEDIDRKVGTFNGALSSNPPRFTDSDNVWNSTTQKAGVDLHWGMEKTYDYFLNKFSLNGMNGAGGPGLYNSRVGNYPLITGTAHVGTNYNNAYWNGSGIYFGDGDGNVFSPLVSIDVVGHEWTHGVTQFTAGLVYSGESGALNESMSDVFGNMIERYAKGDNATNNVLVGEQITTPNVPGDALRNMADPHNAYSTQYDHVTETNTSNCPVHTCSGIPNKVYWLVWEGGTHHNQNATSRYT